MPTEVRSILSELEVHSDSLVAIWVPRHDDLCRHAKLRDMLLSNMEAVGQVDSLACACLVHLEILVESSHVDVSQTELKDDGSRCWW